MAKFDPKSLKAEEFINHEEILATIEYAEKNKHNVELIDEILEKAENLKGLDYMEVSVLLHACENSENSELRKKIFYLTFLFSVLYLILNNTSVHDLL